MRKERLTKTSQFAAVYEGGDSRVNKLVVMKALPNGLQTTRCGFTVSKRVGNAVVRNRVKRRIREGVNQMSLEPGWEIVFVARAAASKADYHSLEDAARGLLRQAHLLRETEVRGS